MQLMSPIGGLQRLEKLYLRHNQIYMLPEEVSSSNNHSIYWLIIDLPALIIEGVVFVPQQLRIPSARSPLHSNITQGIR